MVISRQYSSIEEAKAACSRDGKCLAIQDYDCNNSGVIHICKTKSTAYHSTSCVYRRGYYNKSI